MTEIAIREEHQAGSHLRQRFRGRACEFCHCTIWKEHLAREMMLGLRTPFVYQECSNCGVLCLSELPSDIAKYYPPNYYSLCLKVQATGGMRKLFYRAHLAWPRLMHHIYPCGAPLAAFAGLRPKRKSCKVLDVGSGNGELIGALRDLGIDAMGIDTYLSGDTYDRHGVRVMRCDLHSLGSAGKRWNIIMFHHSLEHIPNHVVILDGVRRLLAPGGICMVRMPIAGWAWRYYGTNWVQLDAPRHLIIHTQKSFCLAVQQAGLEIMNVAFDSRDFQFWGSELYRRDIPLFNEGSQRFWQSYFTRSEISRFRGQAKCLNRMQDGDQAVFILKEAGASGGAAKKRSLGV